MSTTTHSVTLPPGYDETERGNGWLITEDGTGHNAWIRLEDDHWLEIEVRPDNYPGLSVATIRRTDAELLRHILEHCSGMWIRKLNSRGAEDFGERVPDEESFTMPTQEKRREEGNG